ncbi:MAG: hypothetical protein VST71_07120 [Nitrospirota bacterium]|nr:hypothetical protein [Nitrospirota bacterium]
MSSKFSLLIAAASVVAAWVAALFAYVSARTSKRALLLAEQQEKRRQPKLVPYLVDGYHKSISQDQFSIYAFSLSISNPSDIDNSIAQIEFQIAYTTATNAHMVVKVQHDDNPIDRFGGGDIKPFLIPESINAHLTIAGWAFFKIDDILIGNSDIDAYTLIFTDSHGAFSTLEPNMVREFADEEKLAEDVK